MHIFNEVSPDNTPIALQFAFDKAVQLSTDVVLSTTSGDSAVKAVELATKISFANRIVVVTHVFGMKKTGENELTDENRLILSKANAIIVTAAHTLSGVERAISGKFGGVYPVEVMAHTLRMFSQGVKVCVEIASMAIDAGAIQIRPTIALGGTGNGLDTAVVITPGYSAKIFETRIHEILCKPY